VETLFKGGVKEVYLAITHPILVGAATGILNASHIKELVGNQYRPRPRGKTVRREGKSTFHRAFIV